MTAATTERVRPASRVLLHIFWAIHRAIYRGTGGRIGLSRPVAGKRFGMLRLATVGRRSGKRREAMIGYYPDGQNLVTLAMNGWGDAEPAWWLNLLAQPEVTVNLPSGQRAVRAREAIGVERERLWNGFRDYNGWGDVEALARHRSRTTAVLSGATLDRVEVTQSRRPLPSRVRADHSGKDPRITELLSQAHGRGDQLGPMLAVPPRHEADTSAVDHGLDAEPDVVMRFFQRLVQDRLRGAPVVAKQPDFAKADQGFGAQAA